MAYNKVNPKQSFPKLEEEVLEFWNKEKIFEESMDRPDSEEFSFYDGPPFATGTPHYGHILAGTIKDVIPRYQTMLGKKVSRRFGWDTHWLPIENIVEKKLWISWKDDIEKIWVYKFNEECRANVFGYVDEWKHTVNRMWRWVDMENDYKTMDTKFMESVWWVFKSIYDKGLVYEGNRIVPYCPRCTTPLSNFEVNQGYKDKQDKTVTVKFKVKNNDNKYILAWTTTPWTLPANLGLAVGEDILYSEILDKATGETYILASDLVKNYYKNEDDYKLIREYKGACLAGIKYEPLFDDFKIQLEDMWEDLWNWIELWENAFSVVIGHHVTTESGTWIVHIAPAYGEDDNLIGKNKKLGFVAHIDDSGKTYNLLENNWVEISEFNELILKDLKDRNLSVLISTINHSYPHCWRCDTPLIYRAISAWYVAVEKIRDKMVANNLKTNWVPENIKTWRFGKWLEQARDWNISRNRYWGSAIPVWQSEDKKEEICIWSIEELYELNKDFGQIEKKDGKYFYTKTNQEVDLHKHFVDEIKIKNPKTWNILKRIPEVLDCWFESGSMPYASVWYMGKGKINFPADFIAEWLDQTRGWFYTLIILSTALFDKPATKNTIVNGIVLAEDGKKMSKSLKNYPDPQLIFDKYWADAMRFYLMNSPVVEAQDFRFQESWVEEVVKKVILPLWNTYSFFTTYANIDNFEKEKWNIYYVRHWETDNNKNQIVNGWNDDVDINETWIKQAHETWKKLKNSGIKFDIIVSSPMVRARHTAEIIKEYIWWENLEIEIIDWFREMDYGKFKGRKLSEIWKEENLWENKWKIWAHILENSNETIEEFKNRVQKAYDDIKEKYKWKNVLFVGHAWNFRALKAKRENITDLEKYNSYEAPKNASITNLSNLVVNPLDKWIISETNKLIKEVKTWLDSYKINEATKNIPVFMDNLTNWYIRRSRKRFWKSENDGDKMQAYNTLHSVLVTVSKVIAPFMPFVSENIFRNLTWKKSVHLEIFPEVNESLIDEELSASMDKTKKIINLGLAWRVNHKIKVRQPLKSVTIWEKLSDYYKNILKEELNVKDVIEVEWTKLAKKICKPNGRKIWPKFGKDVKFIMQEAKSGNFEELDNWNVKVWEFILSDWDFELVFEAGDSNYEIEAGFGMVIAMDPEITQELKQEWIARDLVRFIQDARKEAEFNVEDRIEINIIWNNLEEILTNFWEYIENETLSKINNNLENADLEKEVEINWEKVVLKLKK